MTARRMIAGDVLKNRNEMCFVIRNGWPTALPASSRFPLTGSASRISAVPHGVSAVNYAIDQTCDGSVEIGFVAGFRGILVRRGGVFEHSDYLFFRQDFQVVEGEQQ